MAIRAVQVILNNRQAPVSGGALYLVTLETPKQVELLHPPTLTLFRISRDEYLNCEGAVYWPAEIANHPPGEKFSMDYVLRLLEERLEDYATRVPPKQHPAQEVRRVIAEIKGVPLEDVPQFKETKPVKAGATAPRAAGVRRPGVIDAIKEALDGGFTIDELVKVLAVKFPDREADGMRNTVKCQLARLPKNTGRAITKTGTGNAITFKWEVKK